MPDDSSSPMGMFERYLSVWVALCIIAGVGLGNLLPEAFQAIAAIEYAKRLESGLVMVILPDGGERYLSTPLFTPPKKVDEKKKQLRFFNTMSKKKEEFVPKREGHVTFYSCGPTAYEVANLSLCRRFGRLRSCRNGNLRCALAGHR